MRMEKDKIVFGAVAVLMVMTAAFLLAWHMLFQEPNRAVESTEELAVQQWGESSASESVEDEDTATDEGAEQIDVATEAPAEAAELLKPSIAVTPYTVYMGFAKDIEGAAPPSEKAGNEVVVGYEWEALPNSQMFASVVLPAWDPENRKRRYTLDSWDAEAGVYLRLGKFPSGQEIDFPRKEFVGSTRFRVLGIDPALGICPGDRSLSWDARFTFDGQLGLVRTPITETLAAESTCQL